jgi:hypothetical protein
MLKPWQSVVRRWVDPRAALKAGENRNISVRVENLTQTVKPESYSLTELTRLLAVTVTVRFRLFISFILVGIPWDSHNSFTLLIRIETRGVTRL